MSILGKWLRVTQRDGSVWQVPVKVIAQNRAEHYAYEFQNDVARSMRDTEHVFESGDDYEIYDWAANNMNWSDVVKDAVRLSDVPALTPEDYQEAWVNGEKGIGP